MRRALISIAVVLAVVGLGDSLLAGQLEQRASDSVSALLGAPTQVSLHGRPLTWHLLQGQVPSVSLRAEQVQVPGRNATLPQIDIELLQVEISLAELSSAQLPRAASGTFTVWLDGVSLAALAQIPAEMGDLVISGEQMFLRVGGQQIEITVQATDGVAVLRSATGQHYRGDFSAVAGRPVVDSAAVVDGMLVLNGHLTDV